MNNWKRFIVFVVGSLFLLTCAIGLANFASQAYMPTTDAFASSEDNLRMDTAQDEDKTYRKPRWKDERLDWCFKWGIDCGQPAADHFCRRRRFSGAKDFRAEPNVGRYEPTRVAGTDQVCNQPWCTGFDYITCFGPLPHTQVFAPPAWPLNEERQYRLDWCLNWERDCGKPAADAYCRARGFLEAIFYEADPGVGTQPTILIGTNQICNQKFCTAFQIITCRAKDQGKPLGKAKPPPTPTPTPAPGIRRIQTPPPPTPTPAPGIKRIQTPPIRRPTPE